MIKLGFHQVSIYPHIGFYFENLGGAITFVNRCYLCSGSAVSIGPSGTLYLGDNVQATSNLKLVVYNRTHISENVLFGWDCVVMDTSFHQLSTSNNTIAESCKATESIFIGKDTWVGYGCTIMPGSFIPEKCVVAARSLTNKNYKIAPYSLLAGVPASLKKSGVWRNPKNDRINY